MAQGLFEFFVDTYFDGNYLLFYLIAFIMAFGIALLISYILEKINPFTSNTVWGFIFLKNRGRSFLYSENHDFLMTPKERILEMTFGTLFILYLALSIVTGLTVVITLELLIHFLYFVYICIGIFITFGLYEFFLYKKTRPKFDQYCNEEDSFLSYFTNCIEPEIITLLKGKEFQEAITPLLGYNGQAKKIVQKEIYQIIDKIL